MPFPEIETRHSESVLIPDTEGIQWFIAIALGSPVHVSGILRIRTCTCDIV